MAEPFEVPPPQSESQRRSNPVINGRYRLPDPSPGSDWPAYKRIAKDGSTSWMRATRLASAIQDTYALGLWQQRRLVHGLVTRPSLYSLAASLDPDNDREDYDALCERAKEAANIKESADYGTAVHAFTEQVDRGEDPLIPKIHKADVLAWQTCLAKHGLKIVDNLIERVIIVIELGVAGRWDRVGQVTRPMTIVFPSGETHQLVEGDHVIVDLKTGADLQYAWHEIALQLAIYACADLIWDEPDGYIPPPASLHRSVAFVVHLPVMSGKATLYAVNIERGRHGVLLARAVLDWRAASGLYAPVRSPADRTRAERREALSYALQAVRSAPDLSTLSALYASLTGQGLWAPAVRDAGLARRDELLKRRT